MAVANPRQEDLSSAYRNIIEALKNKGDAAASMPPSPFANFLGQASQAFGKTMASSVAKKFDTGQEKELESFKKNLEKDMKKYELDEKDKRDGIIEIDQAKSDEYFKSKGITDPRFLPKIEGKRRFTQEGLEELMNLASSRTELEGLAAQYDKTEPKKAAAIRALAAADPKKASELLVQEEAGKFEKNKTDPRSFQQYLMSRVNRGEITFDEAVSEYGRLPKPIPTAERDRMVGLAEIGNNLDTIVKKFSPEAIGPGAGRLASAKQYSEALSDEQQTEFLQSITALRNTIIKARSGGAVTPQEADRLIDELPDYKMSPTAFKAKLGKSIREFNKLSGLRRKSLEEANYIGIPDVPEVKGLGEDSRVKVTGPKGETGTVKKGTKLPKGWKYAE